MASCFICGSVNEREAWFDGKEFFTNLIYNFITKNDIHTVYTLSRNMFDDIIEDAINDIRDGIDADLIRVVYEVSPAVSLQTKLSGIYWYGQTVCPTDEVLDPMITYTTLYQWMIDNSDFMLTYCIDDSDTTINVLKLAKERNIKIYNLAEHISINKTHLSDKIIPYKKS